MGPRRRQATIYPAAIGLVVGALLTGLLVPFIEGEGPTSISAQDGSSLGVSDRPELDTASDDGDGDGEGVSGDGNVASSDRTPGPNRAGPEQSDDTPGSSSSESGTSDSGDGARRATDQGVTADQITVAALLLDLGSTGRIGVNTTGVSPEQQKAAFEAYFRDINRRGGIHGRKVVGKYYTFDVTNPDDQLAACTYATEDVKAFVVMAMPGFANAAVLCVTKQHQTPLIITGQGVSRSFYNESEGRLITLQMAGDRQMRNLAAAFDEAGLWTDRKIGIVSSDQPQWVESVDRLLVPVLKEMGHDVVHVSRLATYPRSQGQISIEVQRMRSAGADTVLHAESFLNSTQFVQLAEQQQWRPRHLVSEFGGMTSDFEMQAMPQSFDGAIAMTMQRFAEWRADIPEDPGDAECRELYTRETGDDRPARDVPNTGYAPILYPCGFVRVFEAAAKAAGVELTRTAFAATVPRLGPTRAAWYLPGGFGPGKTDLADHFRLLGFEYSCKCWHVAGPVTPSRFQ